MAQVTIDDARRAKQKIVDRLGRANVVGVGLARRSGSFAVKVNLREASAERLPRSIDGVPVVYEIVGRVASRTES